MKISIILTARCNATCSHCSHDYGPRRREELSESRICEVMDDAAAIQDGQPLIYLLTGGEPFSDFNRLLRVIQHGSSLGGGVYCVSNAFWARSDAVTMAKLSALADAGLSGLSVSVSRFHQPFIPLERPQRALRIAKQLGIFTELKGAVTESDLASEGALRTWRSQMDPDLVSIFPVLPYLRSGEQLAATEYVTARGLPTGRCPAETLTIDFAGIARSCCSPGALDEFLALGSLQESSLADLELRFRTAGRQRVLREKGPSYFACGAISQGLALRLRPNYADPCDLCIHIRSDPLLRKVAEEIAAEYGRRTTAPALP
jgi:hypothetical protein